VHCIFTSTSKQQKWQRSKLRECLNLTTMKTLIKTRTTDLNSMNLKPCGYFGGEFQNKAYKILSDHTYLPHFKGGVWADIMFDEDENVYAVYAEGALTSDSRAIYIELEHEDCPAAFEAMYSKI